jgi:hypothetical protein
LNPFFFGFQNGCNIPLQGVGEGVLVPPCLIDGSNEIHEKERLMRRLASSAFITVSFFQAELSDS